jgi:hypothetical protein
MPRRALSFLLVGLAACGGSNAASDASGGGDGSHPIDAFVPLDAPPGAYGCLGKPVPPVAPNPIMVTGKADTLSGSTIVGVAGVSVKVLKPDGTMLTSTTTAADGSYSFSLPSAGRPVDMYLRASLSGDRDTTLFPATPLYGSSDGGVLIMIKQSDFDLLATFSGTSQDAAKGAIGVVVVDCDGKVLPGAKVTTSPAGDVVYVKGMAPDTTATMTDASGVALVFNVPAGNVTISAAVGGMTLRSHTVNALAGVTTTTAIRP